MAVAAGGIWPQVIQRFQVVPNELTLQSEYIERNIAATRAAYGIEDVEVSDYDAELTAERGQLAEDARTIPGIRLLDPDLVSPTFRQLQQIRQFYAFPDSLDVARYDVDGETRDTVISARELDLRGLQPGQRNWVNDHTVYTHGYGVVAAFGNRRTQGGEPVFFQSGIVAPVAEEEVVTERPKTWAPSSSGSTSGSPARSTASSARPRAPRRRSSTTRTPRPTQPAQHHLRPATAGWRWATSSPSCCSRSSSGPRRSSSRTP